MAEIEFFLENEEILGVVSCLLGMRCSFVPDIHYPSPTITKMSEPLEVQELAATTPHFFVVREDLLGSSLHMREVQTTDQHFFYIDPRTGGPSLQFFWGRSSEKDNRRYLSASWLSYYDWYIDGMTGERKKVPSAIVEIYSEFAKVIRTSYRRIQPSKRRFFVSPTVESMVREGMVLVGLEDLRPDQILVSAH